MRYAMYVFLSIETYKILAKIVLDFDTVLSQLEKLARSGISHGYTVCWRQSSYDNLLWPGSRAVKFIRDQAGAIIRTNSHDLGGDRQPKVRPSGAQAAANALRKILTGEGGPNRPNSAVEVTDAEILDPNTVNPMSGWLDGVSLRKSHFCLLLKPQIVLRSESNVDSVCVLAAVQAKLQSFVVMDNSNVEDPITGKIMTRCVPCLLSA